MSIYKITLDLFGMDLDMDIHEDVNGMVEILSVYIYGKNVTKEFDDAGYMWHFDDDVYDALYKAKQAIIDEQKDMERKYGK